MEIDDNLKYMKIPPLVGIIILALFVIILISCITLKNFLKWKPLLIFESFYRMGSIIFGGGQVSSFFQLIISKKGSIAHAFTRISWTIWLDYRNSILQWISNRFSTPWTNV